MTRLPISVCLFTSTKGHFNWSTYAATLDHLHRQIPLGQFGALYAHIKTSVGSEELGGKMEDDLKRRGFTVEQTIGNWNRGMSHQLAYLEDMRRASKSKVLNSQPYMLLLEDDSLMVTKDPLEQVLARMVGFLDDPDVVSARFIRANDFAGGVPILKQEKDHFFSPYFDFQPAILRGRDFHIANKLIEDNWAGLQNTQCEMTVRLALNTLSRNDFRHVVWLPDYAHTPHIGTADYPALACRHGL